MKTMILDALRSLNGNHRNPMKRAPLPCRLPIILLLITCFALLPGAHGQLSPPPDGCYPNFTTAEGCNALNSVTSGSGNTAIGWRSLFLNTDGSFNTGVGGGALALSNGSSNTAIGAAALLLNTGGFENCALGTDALVFNDTGAFNNTVGAFALSSNVNGDSNNAFGDGALGLNVSSFGNTAVGDLALSNSTGSVNTALGVSSGSSQTTGSNNIYICDTGVAGESNVIKIGANPSTLLDYTATFIGGIYDAVIADRQVFIGVDGKLGTLASSRRYKEDINPMDKASEALFEVKPVTFRYKREIDPSHKLSFGLIAEDVAQISADLVSCDKEGKPQTVRYEAINAMLLNEFLKEHQKVEQLNSNFQATVAKQQQQIEMLTAQLKEQGAQIQRVSAQLQLKNSTAKTVARDQ